MRRPSGCVYKNRHRAGRRIIRRTTTASVESDQLSAISTFPPPAAQERTPSDELRNVDGATVAAHQRQLGIATRACTAGGRDTEVLPRWPLATLPSTHVAGTPSTRARRSSPCRPLRSEPTRSLTAETGQPDSPRPSTLIAQTMWSPAVVPRLSAVATDVDPRGIGGPHQSNYTPPLCLPRCRINLYGIKHAASGGASSAAVVTHGVQLL
jgi:hypothetical protein